MRRYIAIYRKFLEMNFASWVTYKANFINSLLSSLGWGVFSIISILLLTTKVKSVYGWNKDELILLTAAYGVIIGLFHTLFSRNFDRLSQIITYGELDGYLLVPVDSQFLVSMRMFSFASLIRSVASILFCLYILTTMHVQLTFVNIVSFFVLTIIGLMLLYSLWFIFSTIMIWHPRLSNMIDMLFTITGIARYPPEMIQEIKYYLLIFLLPFVVIVAAPTKVVLQKAVAGDVFELCIFAVIFFLFSRWFWKYALRSYTSASG